LRKLPTRFHGIHGSIFSHFRASTKTEGIHKNFINIACLILGKLDLTLTTENVEEPIFAIKQMGMRLALARDSTIIDMACGRLRDTSAAVGTGTYACRL